MAIIAGVSVANLYYNQPLLNMIREELGITEFQANLISTSTQIGYALGLFFIVPLGDLIKRKTIVLTNFTFLIIALIVFGLAQALWLILAASLVIGICSIVPQIFVPIAAEYSKPANKGQHVGFIISGLLIGILASRVFSGVTAAYLGWRSVFFIAAGLMLLSTLVILKVLPETKPGFTGHYRALMSSILSLVRQHPALISYSSRAALAFGAFLGMWSTLAFKMKLAPFYADSNIIGLLGICGIVGALSASFIGKYVKQVGVRNFNIIGGLLMLLAWATLLLGENSYYAIIPGIILLDIGMQCMQLSNQTSLLELAPDASSRINTVFMTIYFIGGSLGTFLAGIAWHIGQWHGVVLMGILLILASMLVTFVESRLSRQKSSS